jgi:hypothetical protein
MTNHSEWDPHSIRKAAWDLLHEVTVSRNKPYPDTDHLDSLLRQATVYALLALSTPESGTAPVGHPFETMAPAVAEDVPQKITYDLVGTFVYGEREYRLDHPYKDSEGDTWRFTDRMECGMPRLHCTHTESVVWSLPHVLRTFGRLRVSADGCLPEFVSTQGDEETSTLCNVCTGYHVRREHPGTYTYQGLAYDLSLRWKDREDDTWSYDSRERCGMPRLSLDKSRDMVRSLSRVIENYGPLTPADTSVKSPYNADDDRCMTCGAFHDV